MKNHIKVLLALILGSMPLFADEGMWLLTQLAELDLAKKGLQIDISEIYHPEKPSIAQAVVLLGGGTAEFVSSQGLLLTNHHVAFGAVQRASSKEKNYLQAGFVAGNLQSEIPAPGYSAQVLEKIEDVTDSVLAAAKGIKDPLKRSKAIQGKIKQIVEGIEKDKKDVSANIASMFKGKKYLLFVHKRFNDVRLVYIPPMSIGNYGGDIDNWMWPRHTGDFSFLRVYMAPDGSGRDFDKTNIPYRPKRWLKVSRGNLNEGDFTFIMGYPGFTTRYRTSFSAAHNLEYYYPTTVAEFQELLELLEKLAKKDADAAIKTASLKQGLSNTMKNYQGKIEGMRKTDFVGKKKAFEKQLMDHIAATPEMAKYSKILRYIGKEYAIIEKDRQRDRILRNVRFAGLLSSLAGEIYGIAQERAKPADQRDPGFSEAAVKKYVEQLKYRYYSYHVKADQTLLKHWLIKVKALPGDSQIFGLNSIVRGDIDKFIEQAYKKSKLGDPQFAATLFSKSLTELDKLNDPFFNMAKILYPEQEAYKKRYEKFGANITDLRKQYLEAVYSWKGSGMYPDANRTIRFTYGNIAGYRPKDAVWYSPFTSLKGVIEKDTGKAPFNAPEKLKELYAGKDFGQWTDPELKDVPIAFTHRCDITGGNSGSPVLNAKGELIGIAFDGNYEAMISDWQYDYDMQRTISVDIRYVMFLVEKMAKAGHLLKEMGF